MTYTLTLTRAELMLLDELLDDVLDSGDAVDDTFDDLVAKVDELTKIKNANTIEGVDLSEYEGDDPYDETDHIIEQAVTTGKGGGPILHPVTKDCPHITYPQTGITHMTDGVLRCDACQGEYDNLTH